MQVLENSALLQRRSYAPGVVDTAIPGWSLECLQTTSGTLDGGTRELHLPGLQLLEEHYRHVDTNHYGCAPRGCIGLAIPMAMHRDGLFYGRPWLRQAVCAWHTDREFEAITPPMDLLCVVVEQERLLAHLQACEQIDARADLRKLGQVFTPDDAAALVARRLAALVDAAFRQTARLDDPALRDALAQDAMEAIAAWLLQSLPLERADRRPDHLANVQLARRFVLDHLDEPLRVADLCQALQISGRSLQDSFQAMLGITPHTYLRTMRLNGARRDLLAGSLIGDAVAKWGFWHWSRFSHDYRALFGERPSETLRRTTGTSPALSSSSTTTSENG